MTILAASSLDLHHVNVGMIVAVGFLILIFRSWLGK